MSGGLAKAWRMDGQVVLVTGAARGLGAAYARCLADSGAHVIVNDLGVAVDGTGRSDAPAIEAAEGLCRSGGRASADASDVSDPREAGALIDRIFAEHQRLDAIVNNAGNYLSDTDFVETSLEDFQSVWRSHVGGTYNLCRAALPHMRAANSGRIVNTVSTQGMHGRAMSDAYAAAKGAVQGLTLSLAAAVRGTGVAVNAISPGAFARMVDTVERPPEFTAALRRNLDPSLVAPAVAWLCHPDCRENGAIISAMAGWFSRVKIGDLDGFWNFAPDVGTVAGGFAALTDDGPVTGASDSSAHAARIIQQADAVRAALAIKEAI